MEIEKEARNGGEGKNKQAALPADPLRSYPAPWKGQLLLACAKCQKKLRRGHSIHPLGKLKKAAKQLAKQDPDSFRLRVIDTPCLKLCPKDGVAVCTQAQLGQAQCSVLRTAKQAQQLYGVCKQQALESKVRERLHREAINYVIKER